MTNPTPVSREDREEAKELLREFAERVDTWNELSSRLIACRLAEARRLASAIRIVLEGETSCSQSH